MATDRLDQQLQFILEIDKLKTILRRTLISEGRRENSAEHSWHLAMMAILLSEHANEPIDVLRVVKMVLVHDIVEIDAGDTFVYDEVAELDKAEREQQAAERIFGLLPAEQAAELRALWDEYEQQKTADARFAYALDRLQPILLNYARQGEMWRQYGIDARRVLARNRGMGAGSMKLWEYVTSLLGEAVARKYLPA